MRKKCSSDQGKLLKFEAEGKEFSKFLGPLEEFIQTVKGQTRMLFFTFFWSFLRSKTLEQL